MSDSNSFCGGSEAGESDENRDFPVPSASQHERQVTEGNQDTTNRSITDTMLSVDTDNMTDSTTPSSNKAMSSVIMDHTVSSFKSTSSTSQPTITSDLQNSPNLSPHNSTDSLAILYKYNAMILHFVNSTKPWMWDMKQLEQEKTR